MKLQHIFSKSFKSISLFFTSLILFSCGTYQNVTNDDGIYGDTGFTKEKKQVVIVDEKEYEEYENNYFTKELDRLNTINDDEIFVDIDDYNYENLNDTIYNENSPWGLEDNNVIVNINLINDPFWGAGFNNWGWGWNHPWALNNFAYWGFRDPYWYSPFWRGRFWRGRTFWGNPYWNPYHNWAWGGAYWGNPRWNNWGWRNNGWNNRIYRNNRFGTRITSNRFGRINNNTRYSVTSRRNGNYNRSNSRVRRNSNSNYSRRNSSTIRRGSSSNRRGSSVNRSTQRRSSSTMRRGGSSGRNNRSVNRSSNNRRSSSYNRSSSNRRSSSYNRSSRSSSNRSARSSSRRSSSRGTTRSSSSSRRRGN